MDFHKLKTAVAKRFAQMSKHTLFRANTTELDESYADKDVMWKTYLAAFRPEDNPHFRERTQHDCSCCRSFVRQVGSAVAIVDGKIMTIWDVKMDDEPGYQAVADKMAAHVRSKGIADLFLHGEPKVGQDKTFEEIVDDTGRNKTKTWEHFFVNLPTSAVMKKDNIPTALGEKRELKNVFLRGMKELPIEHTETVLELIAQNSIYRGAEHKASLTAFLKQQKEFAKLETDEERDIYAWAVSGTIAPVVAGLRNTVIGSLLIELAKGTELEAAVGAFEFKVAPANYKRPTALVTPAMVEKAKTEVEGLGLTSALQRRFARLEDVSVNDVLFADRSARKAMKDSVFDDLAKPSAKSTKDFSKVEEVDIEKFLADILPGAKSLEILFENKHHSNLVSLVAPTDATAGRLFKWDNGFSWAYTGDMADSDIRSKVAAAGGRVDGVLRFSHTWNHDRRNASLMDLHVFHPGSTVKVESGTNDNYGNTQRVGWNHRQHSATGGVQDVDYTDPAPEGYVPVENITYPDLKRLPEGRYIFKIHNWRYRAPTQGGFKAEIECGGNIYTYDHPKPLKDKEWVTVAEAELKDGQFTVKHHLPEANASRKLWNLDTQQFHRVNLVCLSPNFWSGQGVGNKHFMFMLADCAREDTARGFFNEFLVNELNPHRKVLELVGSKVQTEKDDHQLSGLGFSSTQHTEVIIRVTGNTTRVLKIRI